MRIREALRCYIDRGVKNFVIFPYSNLGEVTRHILREFGIREIFLIDNSLCRYNPNVKSIQDFKLYLSLYPHDNIHIIVASQNEMTIQYLKDCGLEANIIIPFESVYPRGSYGPLVENQYLIESIGAFCCFAAGTAVVEDHPINFVARHTFLYSAAVTPEIDIGKYTTLDFNKMVVIGNDVWLGRNVIIKNGVKIGNGVRAAAGAVITKDVPDYAIVAGVPAHVIRYRFTPEQIEKLNKIAWWDWPDEKIRDCYDDFLDINIFLQKHCPTKETLDQ